MQDVLYDLNGATQICFEVFVFCLVLEILSVGQIVDSANEYACTYLK